MIIYDLRARIRWADTDAAARLHNPRIFEYFEDAEIELLRSRGYSMMGGGYDFPRKHVAATFHRVLRLDDPFIMRVSVGKLGNTSIRYDYQVFSDEDCTLLAIEGTMTVVTVKEGRPAPIPEALRAALTEEPS